MTTEETKKSLAARLLAVAASMQIEPGGDVMTAKFVFDLRAAAQAVGDLETLVALIEANPQDERILELARDAGERLEKVNPELRLG
jgi:hypothetical protein